MEKAFDFNTHPLTSRLKNVETAGPDKWRASCPCGRNHAHNDKNKSLTVEYDRQNGALLVYCFTGCSVTEICSETGCSVSDLFIGNNPSNFISWFAEQNGLSFVESYSYCYGSYNDGLRKIRFRKSDGTKDFRWLHNDPSKKSGFSMKHSGQHRLYVAGSMTSRSVFLVEGEKDANTVHNLLNATAVSAENGAARSTGGKWRDEYTQQLTGKTVYILYDNDEIGKQFAEVEAQQIVKTAAAVFLLDLPEVWPDCPEKADISDYVKEVGPEEAAQTLEQLIATTEEYTAQENDSVCNDMIKNDSSAISTDPQQTTEKISGITIHTVPAATPAAAPDDTKKVPSLVTYDADYFNNTEIIAPEPIINKILYPGLGMLGSPAKMGKSYMMLQLAVCVATGQPFMGFVVNRPGPVLYMDLQGTKARTKKRLNSMGYDKMPKGITLTYNARATDNGLFEQLTEWITSNGKPSLIIIDMLEQVKGSQRKTEDAYRADNRILEPLHEIALKYDLSIFCVMHTRKGNKLLPDDDPFNEIIGSVAQFGTADCAWMIIGKRNDDNKRFSTICRDDDDGQQDYEARFINHRWSISGTVEDCAEKRALDDYNNNPIVYTLRKLIQESGGGWYGTMKDLITEVAQRTKQYPAATPEKMVKLISELEYRLSGEGIEIQRPTSSGGRNGRRYRFYIRQPKQNEMDF